MLDFIDCFHSVWLHFQRESSLYHGSSHKRKELGCKGGGQELKAKLSCSCVQNKCTDKDELHWFLTISVEDKRNHFFQGERSTALLPFYGTLNTALIRKPSLQSSNISDHDTCSSLQSERFFNFHYIRATML